VSRPQAALRRWAPATLAVGALLLTGGLTAPSASATTPTAAAPAQATTGHAAPAGVALRTVHYRSVSVRVPAGWPVIDLDADPTACVRLDRNAVYLGTPGAQQNCPAHAVGRADTVWLAPVGGRERSLAATGRATEVGGMAGRVLDSGASQEREIVLPAEGVAVRTAWGGDATATEQAVASLTELAGPTSPSAATTPTASATASASAGAGSPAVAGTAPGSATATAPSSTTSASTTTTPAAAAAASSVLTGMAFDTCAAPSAATMSAWRGSPYAAVGIYIGGSMRACGDGNLNASWVTTVTGYGWGLIPIYVGPQAPCVYQSGLAHISTTQAAAQGKSNAADAVVQAKRFGLGPGSIVYYDMEAYATGSSSCTAAVLTFLTAWTTELRSEGYLSGVYGSPASLMSDLSRAVAAKQAGFTAPDQVWFAHWNQLQNTTDSGPYPAFKDGYWAFHQRLHQYAGGHNETWGGSTVNIDSNWVDAALPGHPTQVSYGTNILGPGSTGFVFTGSMSGWRPMPGQGVKGMAYTTNSTATTSEEQGATWSPSLRPALYAVDAYVPDSGTTGTVAYTVTHAQGRSTASIAQWESKGYRPLGTYLALTGKPITVHLSDSGSVSTARQVAADAMRFTVVATEPDAPTTVTGAPSDGQVVVSWNAAAANGSPVTSYTVTASPGGRSVTVGGSTLSAAVTGLTNGTAYTFSVRATNIVGASADSAASAAVVPTAAGRIVAVAPSRVLDTRRGTTANPGLATALAPHQQVTVHLTGTGTPVPAGATAALVNLTVTGPSGVGAVTEATSGTSLVNFAAGATVANLATLRLNAAGTVTLVNSSGGTVQLIADVQGYVSPTTSAGGSWSPTTPTRLLDTRHGARANLRAGSLAPGETVTVQVGGATGSPVAATALAAALRLTTTNATKGGYLAVSDGGGTTTSALNYGARSTVGNLVFTALSATGSVQVTNHSAGSVDLIVDVQGQVAATGTMWTPVTPGRVLDTRRGTTANPGAAVIPAGADRLVRVAGVAGSPVPAGATAVSANLTVVPSTSGGWLSAAATATTSTSAVNFPAGSIVAGLAFVPLAADGTLVVHNGSAAPIHVIVDVQGYTG